MFSWFGHQSRLVLLPEWMTGHLPASESVFASIILSVRSIWSVMADGSNPAAWQHGRRDEHVPGPQQAWIAQVAMASPFRLSATAAPAPIVRCWLPAAHADGLACAPLAESR